MRGKISEIGDRYAPSDETTDLHTNQKKRGNMVLTHHHDRIECVLLLYNCANKVVLCTVFVHNWMQLHFIPFDVYCMQKNWQGNFVPNGKHMLNCKFRRFSIYQRNWIKVFDGMLHHWCAFQEAPRKIGPQSNFFHLKTFRSDLRRISAWCF